jgi:perosamine synthetase
MSQLRKLPGWVARREEIAQRYDAAFAEVEAVMPLRRRHNVMHVYHLYVIRLNLDRLRAGRTEVFQALRAENIGVNVHYIPVPWHPYYRKLGYTKGEWPVAEDAYERVISLPIWPGMADNDVEDVISAVRKVVEAYRA